MSRVDGSAFNRLTDFVAIHFRHHHVEQHQTRRRSYLYEFQRFRSAGCYANSVGVLEDFRAI